VTAEAGDRQNSDTVSSENNADGFDTTESTESESRFMEGEELLVELMVEGIQVNDILIVKSKQGFVVDLIALMQLLDFNLKISSTGNQLKGWYSKAANTFDITLPDKPNSAIQAKIKGKDYRVDSNSYQVIENLVYVELADIERWFEFSFKLEETELKLLLTTKEPLPIVLKKKRDSAQIANTRAETAVLPFRDEGYKAFSMPVFDMQANQQFYKFNKITTSNTSYSLVGSGDLSYLTSQFYLSGNKDNALADARLSLMRESNKNDLAGPLKLSSFELGDISPVNAGRDATQGQSLGIRASSLSSAESGDNQRVNLVGEIQDGWDIELYRNSILIDRRTGTTGGRYEFNDVELLFGDNNFEIIFYGPQGQIETREEKFSITGNSLASGDNSYAFSLSRNNSKLIDLDDSAQGDQDLFFSSIYRYGFTDWWTGRLGLTYLKPETASEVPQMTREDKRSINLGQNFALGRVLLGTDYYTDQRYTQSYNLDLRTALLGVNWGIGYQNSQYQKDIASEEKAENERLGFGMSGSIPLPIPVAYQNDYSLDKDDTGATITRIGNSLSIRTGYGYLSNSLQYLKSETATSITTNYGSHSSTGPTIGNTN
ncbi:MAG: hypothetical protein K2W88_15300, partial [Pararheinheimera sp.]|nr:hypothetical protein [Rheinheimera sp.]